MAIKGRHPLTKSVSQIWAVALWFAAAVGAWGAETSPDPLGALISRLERQERDLPTFFYRASQPIEVFDQAVGGRRVMSLEKGDLLPFFGESSGRARVRTAGYDTLYAETSGRSQRHSSSEANLIDVYLDVPSGQPVTITSIPGKTWRDCGPQVPENERPCVAWPRGGPETKLKIRDGKVIEEVDPVTGQRRPQLYYLVDVEYPTVEHGTKQERGWVSAQLVRSDPLPRSDLSLGEVQYTAPPDKKPDCKCGPKTPRDQIKEQLEIARLQPSELARQALRHVGACVSGRANPASAANPFRSFLGNHWAARRDQVYFRQGEHNITGQQMFAIDAIARTIFGEMRGCFRNGIRYPMAVARVILNRAYYVKAKGKTLPFVKDTQNYQSMSVEEIVPFVASASAQFSPWNRDDPNLRHVLCPERMDAESRRIWEKSVEIATSAILDRTQFGRDTQQVSHLHFSSGMTPGWAANYSLDTPRVGSAPIDSPRCLRLWGSPESRTFRWSTSLVQPLPEVVSDLDLGLIEGSFH